MYQEFYHFKENPFNVTADPVFFFSSSCHTEAFSHLVYGIQQRKGILLITGEVGTGKTILCRTLLHRYRNHLGNNVKTALILNPSFSDFQLLQLILKDFGIQGNYKNKFDLINVLNEFLLEETSHGHNIILIIDEAQNLEVEQLEQIRLLSNLETEKEKLLQIVLVGQPELCEKLKLSSLRQLNQRIAVRYHILPLERREIKNYIEHRLEIASSKNSKSIVNFTNGAIDTIYESCKGTPRTINILCDRALLAGYTLETYNIDEYIVRKCIQEVDIKIYGTLHELKDRQEDIEPHQMTHVQAKRKKAWHKSVYALLCIFFIIAGFLFTVPSNISNQTFVSRQKDVVRPESGQRILVPESGGNIVEQYTKGYNYAEQGNYKEAVKWYNKSAEQGHAQAQFNLGVLYSKGQGVTQDYSKATTWYHKAAEQGHTQAQFNLGVLSSKGRGVEQDYNEAARWYHKATEQEHTQAQFNLGVLSSKGRGVEQDYKRAARRYHRAAEQGHAQAQFNLGFMYSGGQGVEQDYKKAARWYRRAAEQEHPRAETNLGFMYSKGQGVEQDYNEAARWYRRAAEQENAQAQFNLGVLYSKGQGVEQDYKKAVRWYHKAAEQGHAQAQSSLGFRYEKGQGIDQDYKEAVKWYQKAAEQGIDYAKKALQRLE